MHVARLVAITELKNVPPDIRPFVEFKAAVEEAKALVEKIKMTGIWECLLRPCGFSRSAHAEKEKALLRRF